MSSPRTGSRFWGSRCRRAVEAVAGLAVLLGSLALPLLGLVRADPPVPFCCRGRCCCTGESTDDGDGRPCLRLRCGCGEPDGVVIAASLRLEAVLPAVAVPSRAGARRLGRGAEPASPRNPPHAPPVPPPKRPLPA
jgi:hypothetical protein